MLEHTVQQFTKTTGYLPLVGIEYEFYAEGADLASLQKVYEKAKQANLAIQPIEKEAGEQQYELVVIAAPPLQAIQTLEKSLRLLQSQAEITTSPKPYPDRPGCGMHFHIALLDKKGANCFHKPRGQEDESPEMQHALAGLLELLPESMPVFAPNEASYARFTSHTNPGEGIEQYNNAPTHISWGGNNRTVALRIPDSSHAPETRHIEHRVPGVDADPNLCITAIITAIEHGLKQKLSLNEPKMFGNAYDKQYDFLEPLPASYKEARQAYNEGNVIKNVITL